MAPQMLAKLLLSSPKVRKGYAAGCLMSGALRRATPSEG